MEKIRFVIIFLICTGSVRMESCPEKCVCRKNENANGLKVKCGGLPQTKLTSMKDIDFSAIRGDIVQL